jgi:hypothetical protein
MRVQQIRLTRNAPIGGKTETILLTGFQCFAAAGSARGAFSSVPS